MDVSRRGFLQRLGLSAAAVVTNDIPSLPGSPSPPTAGGPLDEVAKEAAKSVFQTLAQNLQAAGRVLVGTGREFAEGRGDLKKMFEVSDIARDLLSGKVSVNDVPFDIDWVRRLGQRDLFDALDKLPRELTIQDLIGTDIEDSFRHVLGEEGLKNLPSKETRTQIVEVLKNIGGDSDASLGSLRKKLWDRTTEVAKSAYERMKTDPNWIPEDMRQSALENILRGIDDESPIREEVRRTFEEEWSKNKKRWAEEFEKERAAEAGRRLEHPSEREPLRVDIIDHSEDPSANLSIGPRTFSLVIQNAENHRESTFRITQMHVLHFLQKVIGPNFSLNSIERDSVREFPGGVQFTLKDDVSAREFRTKITEHIAKGESDYFELPDRTARPVLGEKIGRI